MAKQIINMDETALYWKKNARQDLHFHWRKNCFSNKAAKDRFTLMFGANAEGDLKMKPLMIYHSENPCALKQLLPVHWYANKKEWINGSIFKDYFLTHLPPKLEVYCKSQDTPLKILILDNSPVHPTSITDLNPNIKVVFLPPNANSLLQPGGDANV